MHRQELALYALAYSLANSRRTLALPDGIEMVADQRFRAVQLPSAALFLRRFVTAAKAWLHFDVYAWNQATKPGRPEGGECQAARALYALLVSRYG